MSDRYTLPVQRCVQCGEPVQWIGTPPTGYLHKGGGDHYRGHRATLDTDRQRRELEELNPDWDFSTYPATRRA